MRFSWLANSLKKKLDHTNNIFIHIQIRNSVSMTNYGVGKNSDDFFTLPGHTSMIGLRSNFQNNANRVVLCCCSLRFASTPCCALLFLPTLCKYRTLIFPSGSACNWKKTGITCQNYRKLLGAASLWRCQKRNILEQYFLKHMKVSSRWVQ